MHLRRGSVFVPIVCLALAACGGGGPASPSPSLSDQDRAAIARQVVLAALGGIGGAASVGQSDDVPLGNLQCQQTCAGSACSIRCPIDERFDCPSGGSVKDEGLIEGVLDENMSGRADLAAAQTYAACRPDDTLTLSGDRSTNATGSARFVEGRLAPEQLVQIKGFVDYVSTTEGSGRCAVELNVVFDLSAHGSADGIACEKPVSVAF